MGSHTAHTPEGLVSVMVGAGDMRFLAAQQWPLDLAFATLDRLAPTDSEIARALARMPQAEVAVGLRFLTLRRTIHALVLRGLLHPGGTGWGAGYTVSEQLRLDGVQLGRTLPGADYGAVKAAAQALVEATSMASKNPAASAPSGSAAI